MYLTKSGKNKRGKKKKKKKLNFGRGEWFFFRKIMYSGEKKKNSGY